MTLVMGGSGEGIDNYNLLSESINNADLIDGVKLSLYEDEYPLAKLIKIPSIIENATRKKVWLKSGGFLVIEETEALNVIDVNSGRTKSKKKDRLGALKVNIEAAKKAADEIRLRNLSGIILIDFIKSEQIHA